MKRKVNIKIFLLFAYFFQIGFTQFQAKCIPYLATKSLNYEMTKFSIKFIFKVNRKTKNAPSSITDSTRSAFDCILTSQNDSNRVARYRFSSICQLHNKK